jgi:hypothetical protein
MQRAVLIVHLVELLAALTMRLRHPEIAQDLFEYRMKVAHGSFSARRFHSLQS